MSIAGSQKILMNIKKGGFDNKIKVLLTGATGFIGKKLSYELLNKGFELSLMLRHRVEHLPTNVRQFVIDDFTNNPDFSAALNSVDCVIHLAGKAHVIDKNKATALNEFRQINTKLTLNLAKQAIDLNVKRFIFLSSIGVNGNQNNQPFLESDTPSPKEPYAVSKHEAEQGLLKLAKVSDLEVVIIRPPLVYGINAPGNFGILIDWVKLKVPLPLPLGLANNKRSLVAIDNLVDFIITCIQHKKAKNEIFLISDGQDISTTKLLRKLASAFRKKAYLLPIPVKWITYFLMLIGKKADGVRLFSSLQVDSSKAKELLDWSPVVTMDEQLIKIANETDF
jgi:nucleoside-diphosphate-sugar epimerase